MTEGLPSPCGAYGFSGLLSLRLNVDVCVVGVWKCAACGRSARMGLCVGVAVL